MNEKNAQAGSALKTVGIAAVAALVGFGAAAYWRKHPSSGAGATSGGHNDQSALTHDHSQEKPGEVIYQCPMHPWILRDAPGTCPLCGMDLVPIEAEASGTKGSSQQIHIDPVVVQNMGVRTVPVQSRSLVKEVRTTGKVSIDETRQVSINAKVMGWAEKLRADFLGKEFRKGETLLEVYSPEWVATQEEYLQALALKAALSPQAADHARHGAEQLVESARRRLEFWDIPVSAIEAVARSGKARRSLPLVAPASGTLVAKNIVEGQSFAPGTELLRLADLSSVWVLGEVAQSDLPFVKLGQKAEVAVAYRAGTSDTGRVSFIAPVTDARAKTTLVRVELKNDEARTLKPEMVVDVSFRRPLEDALTVPEQAVLRTGRRTLVVVAMGQGMFEPREVKLGATAEGQTQVLEGLQEGELAVLSAQFLIDSESNLKAAVLRMGATQTGEPPSGETQTSTPATSSESEKSSEDVPPQDDPNHSDHESNPHLGHGQ